MDAALMGTALQDITTQRNLQSDSRISLSGLFLSIRLVFLGLRLCGIFLVGDWLLGWRSMSFTDPCCSHLRNVVILLSCSSLNDRTRLNSSRISSWELAGASRRASCAGSYIRNHDPTV